MKRRKSLSKMIGLLLIVALVCSILPTAALATDEVTDAGSTPVATVIAGSDFQNPDGNTAGAAVVNGIIDQMQAAGYTEVDGYLNCGDYDYEYVETTAGINTLKDIMAEQYGLTSNMVFTQGNHDVAGSDGLAASGNNDPASGAYGVFVINEDDYMWHNSDEDIIKTTAANLEAYLADKISDGFTAPIFVVSHLPLHYSMRTYRDGDGKYAKYLFDVLNEAGAQGLNIIFLYGHNHSNGWDSYLGGASVYLPKGDTINIADTQKTFSAHTLQFTYMNAGFTGYFTGASSSVDDALTMTAFQIYEDYVVVERYSGDGIHQMGSVGAWNATYNDASLGYTCVTTQKDSPQTITLNQDLADPVVVTMPTNSNITASTKSGVDYDVALTGDNAVQLNLSNAFSVEGQNLTWTLSTSDEGIASVDGMTVTFLSAGTVTITATGAPATRAANADGTYTKEIVYEVTKTSDGTGEALTGTWYEIPGETTYIYRKTDTLSAETKYAIVNSAAAGPAKIVEYGKANLIGSTQVYMDSTGAYITNPSDSMLWTYNSKSKFQNVGTESIYLRGSKKEGNALRSTTDSGDSYTLWYYDSGKGLYARKDSSSSSSYYIGQSLKMVSSSSASASDRVYLYAYDSSVTTAAGYAMLTGQLEYNLMVGEMTAAEVMAMVQSNTAVYFNTEESATGAYTVDGTYTWRGTYDADQAGTYQIAVSYEGIALGTINVNVAEKTITGITVAPNSGTVERGASVSATTGSTLTVTYSDGSTRDVPVTVGMLTSGGSAISTATEGTLTDLTLTYQSVTVVNNYSLEITPVSGNNYPEYPDEGSVYVDKGLAETTNNFQETGVSRVELSVTGVPVKKGADVVLVLDTSSSMNDEVSGSTRIAVLRNSVAAMIAEFNTPGEDGTLPDIRLAITDFNGYTYVSSDDHLDGGSVRTGSDDYSSVFTGTKTLNAGAFVKASDLVDFDTSTITTHSGTNYDKGLQDAYTLIAAIRAQNEAAGEDRDLYVIFMSDGAPFQYNYFSSQSDDYNWNYWLTGDESRVNSMLSTSSHDYFFNEDGKHWTAEAIKGDPSQMYPVIDPSASSASPAYMTSVAGLGAKIYSIGFCLAVDKQIQVASMTSVLENIASSRDLYFPADSASDLDSAFASIASNIKYCATDAYFVDTMGSDFDLQMSSTLTRASDGETITLTQRPSITVSSYSLYKNAEVGTTVNGVTVTKEMVGTRKPGDPTVLETVSFNDAGTTAQSDKVTSTNIMDENGVICAKYFFYNTSDSTQNITLDDGSTYALESETFYWKVGTVTEDEVVLSYDVYLTGAMEGQANAGSYKTNKSAVLYYKNWLGNSAYKTTTSPVLAWESASVSYAFYLVDENGTPIVNQTTGQTGSFALRVKLTKPALYKNINLNREENVTAVAAADVLPEGYSLYDPDAAYHIWINSGGTGGWEITLGTDKNKTTYVDEYGGDPTTVLTTTDEGNDYTHTVVWFAVKYDIQAVADSVVVDYGLPVDISVLSNDMFGSNGTLAAVGAEAPAGVYTEALDATFAETYAGTYGDASVKGTKVRYQTRDMQMSGLEEFAYAVKYESSASENNGYYYGKVRVIPATQIYYEDNYVDFEGDWEPIGEGTTGAVQDEDRPGSLSLEEIDKDNVYGSDSAYTSCSTYSLGSAMKVHVTSETTTDPTATFTFCGTGFEVYSVTSGETGFAYVDIYEGTEVNEDNWLKGYAVETYYYSGALYQIPVIKSENLSYGTYTVVIRPKYNAMFSQSEAFDFYIDAIRIFNPAEVDGNGNLVDPIIETAYKADKEYAPVYHEVRNLLLDASSLTAGTNATGIVFIDKDYTSTLANLADYGPNNEVYLKPGQSIAFQLQVTGRLDGVSVQIGAKAVNSDVSATMTNGTRTTRQAFTTATEMYYSLDDAISWTAGDEEGTYVTSSPIIITNTGSGDAILSLTNVKITDGANVAFVVNEETPPKAKYILQGLNQDSAPDKEWVNPYTDVAETDWFYKDVAKVSQAGIMTGTSASTFRPNYNLTRAQFVTILHRLEGCPSAAPAVFTDVPEGKWYTEAVAWATKVGITKGRTATTFDPNAPVTRQEMATMAARYIMATKGINVTELKGGDAFADDDAIALYAKGFVYAMRALGIIEGKPNNLFDPKGTATRAQAAAVVNRLVTLAESIR